MLFLLFQNVEKTTEREVLLLRQGEWIRPSFLTLTKVDSFFYLILVF